jgi:hypothetical protein
MERRRKVTVIITDGAIPSQIEPGRGARAQQAEVIL